MMETRNIDGRTVVAEVCHNFSTRQKKKGMEKIRQNILIEGFSKEPNQTPDNASMNRMQRENIQECSMCKQGVVRREVKKPD
jgi:hypothetical protein